MALADRPSGDLGIQRGLGLCSLSAMTTHLTKDTLIKLLHEHRAEISALGVKRLGLFGSFVRQQQRADSDVDVLVEFEPHRKTFDNFIALAFLLEDLLGRRVEVVTSEALSPYIGPRILDEVEYVAVAA
jgi:predicted nucleotidyltransferase